MEPDSFQVPIETGTVDYVSGQGTPRIIHIQDAHGLYETQKNIQTLLGYLTERYGTDLLLLEGGTGKIDPEVLNLFPDHPELNLKVADVLLKWSELSGAELFLIDQMHKPKKQYKAYGIEDTETYRKNLVSFKEVLRNKEEATIFLERMDSQLQHLFSSSANPRLKDFLEQIKGYEMKRIDFGSFLQVLRKEAKRCLEVDVDDPLYQKDWPMLVRLFRLQKLEKAGVPRLDHQEKKSLLERLRQLNIEPRLIQTLETQLDSFHKSKDKPTKEIRKDFERLFEILPDDFNLNAYQNLKKYIQFHLLRNEIREDLLFEETGQMEIEILKKLSRNEIEKKIIELFQGLRLLKKLLMLELTPRDFQKIALGSKSIRPSFMAQAIREMNRDKRIKDQKFMDPQKMDFLFDQAMAFYQGAREREIFMAQNVMNHLKGNNGRPVILVTGGFHTPGLKSFFESQGVSYALVSPRITEIPKINYYSRAMLEGLHAVIISYITKLRLMPDQIIRQLGGNPKYQQWILKKAVRQAGLNKIPMARAKVAIPKRSEVRIQPLASPLDEIFISFYSHYPEVQEQALMDFAGIIAKAPSSIIHHPAYKNPKNQKRIKEVLAERFDFIKSLLKAAGTDLRELVAFRMKFYPKEWELEAVTPTFSSDPYHLANWVVDQQTGNGGETLQLLIEYDTGVVPSQVERGRIVSLFLYLENTILFPKFYELHAVEEEEGSPFSSEHHGNIFRRADQKLSYLFNLAPGVKVTQESLEKENLVPHLEKRIREAQWLNLGMLLASAQECYWALFPEDREKHLNPSWMNETTVSLAQAYRAFERRLVAVLRNYNRYRDPYAIDRVVSRLHPEIHEERQEAVRRYGLEEILFPYLSWIHPNPREPDPINHLIPYFRALEAIQLTLKPKTMNPDDKWITPGENFVYEMERLASEYEMAVNLIMAGQSLLGVKLSSEFITAYETASDNFDPFIDLANHKEDTLYYLQFMAKAMREGKIDGAKLPDAKSFNEAMRSEVRNAEMPIKGILGLASKMMDGILENNPAVFDKLSPILFKSRLKQQTFLGTDNSFGIVSIPLPEGIPLKRLLRLIQEYGIILQNHPRKILLLTYPQEISERLRREIYAKSDRRIFIFQGKHEEILKGLYASGGDISKWSDKNKQWAAKHFIPRAGELLGQTARPSALSQATLAVGSTSFFNGLAFPMAKQLVNQSLNGLTPEELLRAYLLFGISYASVPNAVLLKEAPRDLFNFEPQKGEDFVRFSFNSSKVRDIQTLVRAAQKLFAAA